MKTYIIREKQDTASYREGESIKAESLKEAKNLAEDMQFYEGTVLTIEAADGELLSTKIDDDWIDSDYVAYLKSNEVDTYSKL